MSHAQLIDGVLGQRRDVVQVLLRSYRILDYKKERTVLNVEAGIHQTVIFENDTCTRFYWAVVPESIERFATLLSEAGYSASSNNLFVKDSLEISVKELESGKATLFIAALSKSLEGDRDQSGRRVVRPQLVSLETMPLLQQAILQADRDTTPKAPKDPQKNWIGSRYGEVNVLGWEQ